jgi:hypothetical protein
MSGNIVWLASYPKSGNTWLRVFLSNLVSGDANPVHINRILGKAAGDRAVFDNLTGIDSGNLFPAEVDAIRPDWYSYISRHAGDICWMKVHDAYQYLPDQQPIFPQEATRCTIYLVRNPLDVAPSFSRHMNMSLEQIIEGLNDEGHTINAEKENITGQLRQKLSSWSENVLSWVNAPAGMKVHVMRYEDMKNSPYETFSAAVSAIGLQKSEAEIRRALEFSSFATLKEMELQAGFREKPGHSNSFFHEGKVGGGRNRLSREQVARIVANHKEVMQLFGYLDQQGNVVDGY